MKVVFIIKELNDNYRIIEYNNKKRDENIKNLNELKSYLFKYEIGDLVIHDIPLSVYNPNLQKTKATTTNIIEAFGCDWKSYLSQFTFDKFVDLGLNKFSKANLEVSQDNPLFDFSKQLIDEFTKKSFFGSAADYHQYSFDFVKFYDFLKLQHFPDPNSLSVKNIVVDTLKKDSYNKFILSLHMYEGFVVCSSLITDEIQLDEINIFSNSSEIILPFNLFKYLLKYKNINEVYIKRFYISGKKKLNFNDDLNDVEKLITIGGLAERSDVFTKMYVRYYFFIFSLKYFSEDIISIDLKRKIVHTYNKNIKSPLFHSVK